jgi:hypothetical protein
MMKWIWLVGWFFVMQSRGEVPGSYVTTVVGPFTKQSICQEAADMLDVLGATETVTLTKCKEKVEA